MTPNPNPEEAPEQPNDHEYPDEEDFDPISPEPEDFED